MTNSCDLDELKHQVREKALAELKEYIEGDGEWVDVPMFYSRSVKSRCGRFTVTRYRLDRGFSYELLYKGALAHSAADQFPTVADLHSEHLADLYLGRVKRDKPFLGLCLEAIEWQDRKEQCKKYQAALGIEGKEWQPPGSIVEYTEPKTTEDRPPLWAVIGGLCVLALTIGVALL